MLTRSLIFVSRPALIGSVWCQRCTSRELRQGATDSMRLQRLISDATSALPATAPFSTLAD